MFFRNIFLSFTKYIYITIIRSIILVYIFHLNLGFPSAVNIPKYLSNSPPLIACVEVRSNIVK